MDDDYVWLDDDDAFDTEDSLFDYFEYMEDELECGIEDGIEVKNADDRVSKTMPCSTLSVN